ncbi:MAG: WD40/YVTN/BNR-like repeat-containing protein, partial [Streptosporangiaceae bacterium]
MSRRRSTGVMTVLAISAVTASACGSTQAPTRPARHGPTAAPPVSVVRDAGTGPPVWDIALATPGRAFAALSEGLGTSANGGLSWTVRKLSSFPAPVSLDLVSGQVAFAAGYGKVLRTVDGGRTWQSLRPPAAGTYAVDFWAANAGVAMVPNRTGPNSGYFVTRDGARTWRRLRIPGWALLGGGVPTATTGGNLVQSSVCFAPGGTGWAVASRAGHVSLLVSPDGGRRWRVALPGLPPGPPDDLAERPAAVVGCTEHAVWAVVTQWGRLGHLRAIDLL